MSELGLHDELAAIVGDLRTWIAVQQGDCARVPRGPAPELRSDPAGTEGGAEHTPPVESSSLVSAEVRPEVPEAVEAKPAAPTPEPEEFPPVPETRTPSAAPASSSPADRLLAVLDDIGDCTRCKLHEQRTHVVFGSGSPEADIVFVGEGPGYNEDQQGEPFVGKAGELLTAIIENVIRLSRSEVYICNVVKCRPPNNRDPEPDEVATCSPFLWEQLGALQPKVVVGLGRFAVQTLLETDSSIGRLRGRVHPFRGIAFVPTYHPAYLLRNPSDKRKVLEDMKLVRMEYERATGRALPEPLTRKEASSR